METTPVDPRDPPIGWAREWTGEPARPQPRDGGALAQGPERLFLAGAVLLPLAAIPFSRSGGTVLALLAILALILSSRRQGWRHALGTAAWPSGPWLALALLGALVMAAGVPRAPWPLAAASTLAQAVGSLLCAALLVPVLARCEARRVAHGPALALILTALIIVAEAFTDMALYRATIGPLRDLGLGRQEAYFFVYNRPAVLCVLLLFPAAALCRAAKRPRLALASVAAVAAAAALSASGTAQVALAGGIGVGILTALLGRWPVLAVGLGAIVLLASAPWHGDLAQSVLPERLPSVLAGMAAAERQDIWLWYGIAARQAPLLGHGLLAWRELPAVGALSDMPAWIRTTHPHDMFLQVWVEFGALGALPAAAALWLVAARALAHQPAPVRPFAAGLFVALIVVAAVGYSLWSPWIYATLAFAASWFAVAGRADYTGSSGPMVRGAPRHDERHPPVPRP